MRSWPHNWKTTRHPRPYLIRNWLTEEQIFNPAQLRPPNQLFRLDKRPEQWHSRPRAGGGEALISPTGGITLTWMMSISLVLFLSGSPGNASTLTRLRHSVPAPPANRTSLLRPRFCADISTLAIVFWLIFAVAKRRLQVGPKAQLKSQWVYAYTWRRCPIVARGSLHPEGTSWAEGTTYRKRQLRSERNYQK